MRKLLAMGLMLLPAASAWGAPAVQTMTLADYQAQVQRVRAMMARCRVSAEACDVNQIGPDSRIAEQGGFEVHWGWLRGVVEQAHAGKPEDTAKRQEFLAQSAARVDTIAQEAGASTHADFSRARAETDRVLAGAEFKRVEEVSLWERLMSRFWGWVSRMLNGVVGVGSNVPWMAPLLEWGFVVLCCTALLLWALRVMRRQRLEIALERPTLRGEWEEVSRQWADGARRAAQAGDWREAVHSLYWATVVELEGRKVWRQHRDRTPREYLRLLETGSKYRSPVAALTQIFERIWYGLREAQEQDYARVLALYDEVRAA